MPTEKPNDLDQKLNEINKLFKQLEQVQKNTPEDQPNPLERDLLENLTEKIQAVKTQIEKLRNYTDDQVELVLEEMWNHGNYLECNSLNSCMIKNSWLEEFKLYKAQWDECQKEQK